MRGDPAILILGLGQTLVWAGLYYSFPAALLIWESDLGWARADLALAFTGAVLASGLASPLAGRLIDQGHGPAMMGLATALGGVALALLPWAGKFWQFMALWLVIGLCLAGALYDACFALLTHMRGAGAKRGIILITLLAGFAGTIAFPLVHALSAIWGWRGAMICLGLGVTFLVAPLQWWGGMLLGPSPTRPTGPRPSKTALGYYASGQFWALGLAFALAALVHGAALGHLLPLLDERGLATPLAVTAAALVGPAQVAGRLVMLAGGDRISAHRFAGLSFLLLTISVLVLLFAATNITLIFVYTLFFGAAYGLVSILRPVIIRDLLGDQDFGVKSGHLAMMYRIATAFAVYIGALLWQGGGYGMMLWVLAGLATLGGALYTLVQRYGNGS